jgi:predicted site-specific integrase-resolvase
MSNVATTDDMDERPTMTTQQAADYLGVHPETFRLWVRRGDVDIKPIDRPRRPKRWLRADVVDLSTKTQKRAAS